MRCAIYARKSTEEPDKHADNKSTTRQVEHAKRFIEERGWTCMEEHVYVDDGISGAEFQNRPGFQALIAALKSKQFDAVVCSEPSRLGRDMTFTAYFVRQITDAEVRIFYYLTGEEEKADTPEARLIGTIKGYADEMERVKARQRVRDAHHRLASQGYSTGAKVYGYRSVHNDSHVRLEIDPEQAEVVQRIFRMYADGYGLKLVARQLNEERIAPPRPKNGSGWWDGTIRAILHQELYRGRMVWGRTQKEDRGGRTGLLVKQRDKSKWVVRDCLELVIVDQGLWDAVHERLKEARTNFLRDGSGRLLGRPSHSPALLAGLAVCGVCSGGMIRIAKGGSPPKAYYACVKNHKLGDRGCVNNLRQRIEAVDTVFLDGLQREVLTPPVVRRILELAAERLRREQEREPSRLETLKKQRSRLRGEIARLVVSIVEGNAPQAVMEAIRDREAREKVLVQEIARLEAAPILVNADLDEALEDIRRDLDAFGDVLRESRPKAKLALSKVLDGRLTFQAEGQEDERYYRLTGDLKFGKLLTLLSRPTKATNAPGFRYPLGRRSRKYPRIRCPYWYSWTGAMMLSRAPPVAG